MPSNTVDRSQHGRNHERRNYWRRELLLYVTPPTQLRGLLHTLELLATAISFPTLVIHVLQLIPPVQLIICLTIKRDMSGN